MTRRKHITKLQSIDLLLGRKVRILEVEFLPTVYGLVAKMRGCYTLTATDFEIIIIDKCYVKALHAIQKPANKMVIFGDYGDVTELT